jgi:selenide,water dikinase
MVDATTKLNRPGAELAKLEGVHALTDVTGFGLLGHGLELARGAQLSARIESAKLPVLPGVQAQSKAFSRAHRGATGHPMVSTSSWHRP